MRVTIVLLILGAWLAVFANDCPIEGVGGRIRRMSGEHPAIRMVRETLTVDVYPEYYDVDVTFAIKNTGPATSVKMGFPERGYGGINPKPFEKKPGYRNFHTWVDGVATPVTRVASPVSEEELSYHAYWVKTVKFAAGQSRTVRVSYRARAGREKSAAYYAVYNFTGGNWQGKVAESTAVVTLHLPGVHAIDAGTPTAIDGNRLRYRWTNWEAEEELHISYVAARPDSLFLVGLPSYGMYSWYSRLLVQPGDAGKPGWTPPIIQRNGRPFIALHALAEYLNKDHKPADPSLAPAKIAFDATTHETILKTRGHTLRFAVKRPEMQVDDVAVKLPEGPFLSLPSTADYGQNHLYLPAEAVVTALGGTLRVDPATRRVTLNFPPVKTP